MADYGALRIIVTADTSTMGRQIIRDSENIGNEAGKTLGSRIASGVSGAASLVGGAFKSIAGVAANTLGGAALAATGFGVSAIGASLRVDELNLAMSAVAKGTGKSLPEMQAATKGIAKQGVAYADAQKLVLDFSRANLSMSDAQKVATTAQDLAVLSGKSSSETTAILTEAIIKQSPQLLEAAGVTTNLTDAQDRYSKVIGVAGKDMTVAQKQQALLNEVLRQGGQVSGSYQLSMQNAGKVIRSLPRLFNDLAVSVGSRLTPAVSPLVLKFYDIAKAFVSATKPGGSLAPIIESIGKALSSLTAPVAKAMDLFEKWFKNLKPGQFSDLASNIQKMAGPIAAVAAGLATFAGGNLLGAVPVLGKLFGTLGGPIGALAVGIGTLVATSPELRAAFASILEVFQPLLPILASVGKEVAGVLSTAMVALAPVVAEVGRSLAGGLVSAVTALAPALPPLAAAFAAVLAAITPLLPQLAALIVSVVNSGLVPIVLQLADVISKLATSFPGATAGVIAFAVAFGPLKSGVMGAVGALSTFGASVSKVAGASGFLDKIPALDGARLKFMGFGESLTKLGPTVAKGFKAIGVAIQTFSAALLTSPITWIIVGIVALGAAIFLLYKKWAPFRNLVDGVWQVMKGLGQAIGSGVMTAIQFLSELPGKAVQALSSLGTSLLGVITGAFQAVVTGVQTAIGWIVMAFGKLGDILAPVGAIILKLIQIITFPLIGLKAIIGGLIDVVVGVFTGNFSKIISGIGGILSGVIQMLLAWPILAFNAIVKFGPMVWTWITGVFTTLKNAVVQGIAATVAFFAALPGRVIAAIISLATRLSATGRAALAAMGSAIAIGISKAVAFFASLPGKAVGALASLGSRIVSTGRTALSSMGSAISTGISTAVTFFSGLPAKAASALSGLPGKLKEIGTTAVNSIKSGAESAWSGTVGFFSGLPGKMISAVGNVASTFSRIGSEITSGIISGIGDVAGAIWAKISGGLSGLVGKAKGLLGIHSPSTVFRDEIGKPITQGVIVGIESQEKALTAALDSLAQVPAVYVPDPLANVSQTGSEAIVSASQGMAATPGTEQNALLRTLIRMLEAGTTVNIDGQPIATAMSAQTLYGVSA